MRATRADCRESIERIVGDDPLAIRAASLPRGAASQPRSIQCVTVLAHPTPSIAASERRVGRGDVREGSPRRLRARLTAFDRGAERAGDLRVGAALVDQSRPVA